MGGKAIIADQRNTMRYAIDAISPIYMYAIDILTGDDDNYTLLKIMLL